MSRTNNHVRDSQGVIVTLAHRATGDTVSIHRPGSDEIERPITNRPELVLLARIGAKAYL